jgi:flagellar biosynthesis chaperone FliJ
MPALKRQIAETKSAWDSAKAQISNLTDDQNRLRQNIDSLNRVKGQEEQVRNYSEALSKNEALLAQLRDRENSLTAQQAQLNARLRDAMNELDL